MLQRCSFSIKRTNDQLHCPDLTVSFLYMFSNLISIPFLSMCRISGLTQTLFIQLPVSLTTNSVPQDRLATCPSENSVNFFQGVRDHIRPHPQTLSWYLSYSGILLESRHTKPLLLKVTVEREGPFLGKNKTPIHILWITLKYVFSSVWNVL